MKKKKQTKKQRKTQEDNFNRELAEEELGALSAIFEELKLHDEAFGFSLRVLPEFGEGQTNYVAFTMNVTLPKQYPEEELQLRLTDAQGLTETEVHSLSKMLHNAASTYAATGEVCCFQLIQLAQEQLQVLNTPPKEVSAGPESLWHTMQQRELAGGEELSDITDTWAATTVAVDQDAWLNASTATPAARLASPTPPQNNKHAPGTRPAVKASPFSNNNNGETTTVVSALPPRPPAVGPTTAAKASDKQQQQQQLSSNTSGTLTTTTSLDPSGSLGHSFSTVLRGIGAIGKALLPRALQSYATPTLELDASSDEDEDTLSDSEESSLEREQLRKDLLLGHLLRKTMGQEPRQLSAVAAMLQQQGLAPQWLCWTLIQQPQLFDRAFKRVFAKELADGSMSNAMSAQPFWKPSPSSGSVIAGQANTAALASLTSRYKADFSEERTLGKGGYGLVVLATNRIDGRQYAIKKVKLSAASPREYDRIMREVTTLSRLHHPNVVRYFQAWVEEEQAHHHHAAHAHQGSTTSYLYSDTSLDSEEITDEITPSITGAYNNARLNNNQQQPRPRPLSPLNEYPTTTDDDDDDDSHTTRETAETGVITLGDINSDSLRLPTVDETDDSDGFTFDRSKPQPSSSRPLTVNTTTTATDTATATDDTLMADHQHAPKIVRNMLYIQMEFCPRTLRDALDSGSLTEPQRWSTLRQILAGLSHIHTLGIVHRDLKPANLFYDAKGEIKLGDFGLAKFRGSDGTTSADADDDAAGVINAGAISEELLLSDVTGVCGTSFYISPEIAQGSTNYDGRADVWSCSIIIFELWNKFSTAMERAVMLRDLREKGIVPEEFERENPTVTRLIRWLGTTNPAERPTAKEVLRSELLPAAVGEEEMEEVLRSLADNPAAHDKVLDQLFAMRPLQQPEMMQPQITAGAPVAELAPSAVEQRANNVIQTCFARHGAVQMNSYDIGMAPETTSDDHAVRVLSRTGTSLALRKELRKPFALWLTSQIAHEAATSLADGLRRWEIAQVHLRTANSPLPRSLTLADFDIVYASVHASTGTSTQHYKPVVEAEALCVAVDVLQALPELNGRWEIRLSHRALADAALAYAGISRELRPAALQVLTTAAGTSPLHSDARSKRWLALRAGLEGLGVGKEGIDKAKRVVLQGAGEARSALHWLETTLTTSHHTSDRRIHNSILAGLQELKALLPLLAAWNIPSTTIAIDPLLSPQSDYYEGLLLQVHLVDEASGNSFPLVVGGRYDGLIKAAWARQTALSSVTAPPPSVSAVGITINVDRLLMELAAIEAVPRPYNTGGMWQLSTSDVLVCSRGGGGLLMERMQLLKSLWDAGLAAETLPSPSPSLTDQYGYASSRHIPWLVIISKASFTATDTVKVKHLHGKTEEEVAATDVASFIKSMQPHHHHHGGGGLRPVASLAGIKAHVEEDAEYEGKEHRRRRDKR